MATNYWPPCADTRVKKIRDMAQELGWRELDFQANISLIRFYRANVTVREYLNIYFTRMTVGTCIEHPKKGRTQLFRRHVNPAMMRAIMQNPRVHTGEGYYTRGN